jgi:hypothetical protein
MKIRITNFKMDIFIFLGNLKRIFKKAIEVEEALAEEDSNKIIMSMSNEELENAIVSGKQFIELTSMVRFHQEYLTRQAILDPNDPEYKGMDSRSLGYMLSKSSVLDSLIVAQLIEERDRRDREVVEKK